MYNNQSPGYLKFDGYHHPKNVARQNDAQAAALRTHEQGAATSDMATAIKMMQLANSIMSTPGSTAEEMQMARMFQDRAYGMMQPQQQQATPFGMDYQTGQMAGPYSMGATHDRYNDDILSRMNPAVWGGMQQLANPAVNQIYNNYNQAQAAGQNYVQQLNRDMRAPATYTNDPVTGDRKLLWAPDQKSITAQKDNYMNQQSPMTQQQLSQPGMQTQYR